MNFLLKLASCKGAYIIDRHIIINNILRNTKKISSRTNHTSCVCTKTYQVPGSDVVLEKGTAVQIPCWGVHMDPEYYPNPEVWDPERFSKEEKAKRPEFFYFLFGEGPRVCIGLRFGMMQARVGLVGLLKDHHYTVSKDTPDQIIFATGQFLLHAVGSIWLNVAKTQE